MAFKFYYDESEHSRKISQATIEDPHYYENFVTVIVGWDENKEAVLEKRYAEFEEKYEERKHKGELKRPAIKFKQFKNGFASMSPENLDLVSDFLDLFNDDVYIYFSVQSKMEYVLIQLLSNYRNSFGIDVDAMRYSLVKAIHVYKPQNVIDAMYNRPVDLIDEIENFLFDRIEANKANLALKQAESDAFTQALIILDDLEPIKSLDWDYHIPFDGFAKYLRENSISEYCLTIDKEGSEKKTLTAAIDLGHINISEADSADTFGIRMADMLAGIITKLMKALSEALISDYKELKKVTLDSKWFRLDDRKRKIYHKLHNVIMVLNNSWYKAYAGTYSDDLILFTALLEYINTVPAEEMQSNINMQGEYFNSFCTEALKEHFIRIHNKLNIEPVTLKDEGYYIDNYGAKVFADSRKQPALTIENGQRECKVLCAGVDMNGVPTVTIAEEDGNYCYRIPQELSKWIELIVGYKLYGIDKLPAMVKFYKHNGIWDAIIIEG